MTEKEKFNLKKSAKIKLEEIKIEDGELIPVDVYLEINYEERLKTGFLLLEEEES